MGGGLEGAGRSARGVGQLCGQEEAVCSFLLQSSEIEKGKMLSFGLVTPHRVVALANWHYAS